MPTSARWEVTNSPKISVKSTYSAGGQSRPPLQGELRLVVGADDSVGPLGSCEFAEQFCKKQVQTAGSMCTGKRQSHIRNAPSSRTAVAGIDPYEAYKYSARRFELFQISRERSKKTEAVFLVGSRGLRGKIEIPPGAFPFGEAKENAEGQLQIRRSFQPSCGFIICVIDPKIYSRPGVLGREHTCFVVPPKFGGVSKPPSCAGKRAAQSPAISARSALYACSADVLPGAAAKTSQRHGLLSGQAGNRYCFRVVAKFKVIGSSSCSSSSYANPDRRAAIRGSAFQPRPDSSRTGRWTSRTGAACA